MPRGYAAGWGIGVVCWLLLLLLIGHLSRSRHKGLSRTGRSNLARWYRSSIESINLVLGGQVCYALLARLHDLLDHGSPSFVTIIRATAAAGTTIVVIVAGSVAVAEAGM